MTDVVSPFWKSSYSQPETNCVEVADAADDGRAVRDSKQPASPLLTASRESWHAFIRQFG
ncbi:DUF397 domain-containing protein [Streptomyces sp. NPDC059477]|uniref:DUF397 domain-containing protein n=1 Tax=Streptomyces sp. NPDC059477 TaxID=3346847 RepID=UPI003684261D